jgi:gluconokinase
LFNTFEIDHSIASATGLFDIEQLQWHQPSLELCGITSNHLSNPVSTHHQRKGIGAGLAQQLALAEETIFVIGASDGCMANLGSFAIQPGVAALTIGTSGAIRVAGTTPVSDFDAMPFNYRLDENIFISGGPINNGGIALRWYAENFLGRPLVTQEDYDGLLSLITGVPAGSEGLLFLPYLQGERAPIWNSEACGVFFGITSLHSQAYFTRSVLEGVSLALYQIARSLEDNGMAIHRIHVSGGFVRSLPWLQLLTDVFGKEVRLIHAEDASALGAVFLAMKALGIIKDYSQLDPGHPMTLYPNEANHIVYREEVFPRYVQLYKALTLEMSVLHDTTQTKLNPIQ